MHAIFLAIMLVANPWDEEEKAPTEKNGIPLPQCELCFFPPDIVPHPHIPHEPPEQGDWA